MLGLCLSCYLPLNENEIDFHGPCSKKLFGQVVAPKILFSQNNLLNSSNENLVLKLSLKKGATNNFAINDLDYEYILKLPNRLYIQLPEMEDLTMHLAAIGKIKIVLHSLIRLASGNLGYISKRFDRTKKEMLLIKDMCQLLEKSSEDKYTGSYEQIIACIQKHTLNPGLDVVNFFEILLFTFLTGNSDMHLKNFSLIHQPKLGYVLAPAYDLVSMAIVYPVDDEDFALTLNGKKKKIRLADFIAAANTAKLDNKQQQNIFNKMLKAKPHWLGLIDKSFLSDDLKASYKDLIDSRFARLTKNKS